MVFRATGHLCLSASVYPSNGLLIHALDSESSVRMQPLLGGFNGLSFL